MRKPAALPHIHVSCGIIERDGQVLAAQRSRTMSMPLKWEFPGGKIDPGETPQCCLKRELQEELGILVRVGRALPPVSHAYPGFRVTLYPFVCTIETGDIVLHEHADTVWLPGHRLHELDWAEADGPVIAAYLASCG